MSGAYDLLIYLDESLTKNLNSLVINGFIEKRTSRWIEDRSLSGSIHFSDKEQKYEEDRFIKDERDGYKGKNSTTADTFTDWHETGRGVDGRRIIRREEELTRIYTTFEIHQQLKDGLASSNNLSQLSSNWLESGVSEGDFIEITGTISTPAITTYLNLMSNITTMVPSDKINYFLNDNSSTLINYDVVLTQLMYLNNLMTSSPTEDIIVKTESSDVVVTINNNFFLSDYGNVYEKVGCSCKVFGKVVKVYNNNEHIHMLRKTGQPLYYEKLFNTHNTIQPYIESNGILLPDKPTLRVNGETLMIIPISICI